MSNQKNTTKAGKLRIRSYESKEWGQLMGIGELSAGEKQLFQLWLDDPQSAMSLSDARETLLRLRKMTPKAAAKLRSDLLKDTMTAVLDRRRSGSTIVLPPGDTLARVTKSLLTQSAYKRYVEPVIADMQQEYLEAVAAGHERHAQLIALRVYLLIIPGWLYGLVAGKLAALLRRGR